MFLLVSTLGVLGWRLAEQERQLSEKRLDDHREVAAGSAVIALERRLASVESDLDRLLMGDTVANVKTVPGDGVFVRFDGSSFQAWPDDRLIYRPQVPEAPEPSDSLFGHAEELVLQKRDYAGAIAELRTLADSEDPKIRAVALVLIAGNQKKSGKPQDAVATYSTLTKLGDIPVRGLPAALSGRLGLMKVFEEEKDHASLMPAARALAVELHSGRWLLSREAYESLWSQVSRVLPESERGASKEGALAQGVHWIWDRWGREGAALEPARKSLMMQSGPIVLVWKRSGNQLAAFAASTEQIQRTWLDEMEVELGARRVKLVFTDDGGRPVVGNVPTGSRTTTRFAAETGLPWTIQAFSTGGEEDELRFRRRLLLAGVAVLFMLILTGGWLVGHAVTRELEVARLQSDFVSIVSHEFRTPLTALCQLTELLKRGRLTTEDDRRQSYDFLHHESHRLRRLVEALLDFGRLESGRMQFRFETLDAAALLRQTAAEFVESEAHRSHHLDITAGENPQLVRADRETLRCVFWNLLENAVKYSPDCDTVWLNVTSREQELELTFRDQGVGIPRSEQQRIFEKFVRGDAARSGNVGGTGIGLATARKIVRAHGGTITVDSEPGRGSTFRVLLPLLASNGNDLGGA